jgi:hypothetical protein
MSQHVRKQCCFCGTLHPLSHTGHGTSCFGDSWRLWCVVLHEVLDTPSCSQCARDERKRKMIPARVPLIVRHAGGSWRLEAGPIIIGRDDDCDIRLSSDAVSRRHCELSPLGSRWRIRDLESTNGTFLDTAAVTAQGALVADDALLRLGAGPVLELSVERPPEPAMRPATRTPPAAGTPLIIATGRAEPARATPADLATRARLSMPDIDPVAITALVFSVVALLTSFTVFGWIAALAALALAATALKRISDAPFTYRGMGPAVLALVLGGLALVLSFVRLMGGIEGYL